ncbi:erythromycin esterase family protein [Bacillus sp. PS06]|uniref:erythromycin esterase family protein n=1 Tax=Bacillus sp. PS06 TaxID=2764176 RepID=UPI00177D8A16|nr:erythromycin esterase family protein [Bacillus sp. PS06]MBD8071188.1 erythromycin esterase family protein [Bacillus sp. PS06]
MNRNIIQDIRDEAIKFESASDLQKIVDAIGSKQFVLLGEASHGTSEFYSIRAELSKMLIEQKGFNVIAVEGDWPSCFEVNRYIKGYENHFKSSEEALLKGFNRWPTWMWANEEIAQLCHWLKEYNGDQEQKVGFYGIDVYSLWESMEEVISYLQKTNSPDVEVAKKAYSCFEPFNRREDNYGVSASFLSEDCIDEVIDLLTTVRRNKHKYSHAEEDLNLDINSLVAANAERYYRAMVKNDTESWNVRDYHMSDVIDKLVEYYGQDTKVIVWEHNTHIGDARYTDMKNEGIVNVGQIVRERYGEELVYAVGFGTHRGPVIAAKRWGDDPEVMEVPNGAGDSWEDCLHQAGAFDQILLFDLSNREKFSEVIGHRAIGVVYHPEYEHLGNYVPSVVSSRYDAFVFVDRSHALVPLKIQMLV